MECLPMHGHYAVGDIIILGINRNFYTVLELAIWGSVFA